MVVHEEVSMVFPEDLRQEIDRVTDELALSYILYKKRGIIKEPPSYHDVLREVLSTSVLSTSQYNYIKYSLGGSKSIDTVDSIDPIPVIQKSTIEKPANNPCKDLPTCDVVGQETSW